MSSWHSERGQDKRTSEIRILLYLPSHEKQSKKDKQGRGQILCRSVFPHNLKPERKGIGGVKKRGHPA